MTRFIRTLAAAALALATLAPATASAFDFGGPIVLPPPGGFQLQCGTADLAATIVDVYDLGYGWLRVTVEVSNEGSVDFQAAPGRAGVYVAVGNHRFIERDITWMTPGRAVLFSEWVRVPGYAGSAGEPQFGQCEVEAQIIARISYDPDLGLDGDPMGQDCLHLNNADEVSVAYLAECID